MVPSNINLVDPDLLELFLVVAPAGFGMRFDDVLDLYKIRHCSAVNTSSLRVQREPNHTPVVSLLVYAMHKD